MLPDLVTCFVCGSAAPSRAIYQTVRSPSGKRSRSAHERLVTDRIEVAEHECDGVPCRGAGHVITLES